MRGCEGKLVAYVRVDFLNIAMGHMSSDELPMRHLNYSFIRLHPRTEVVNHQLRAQLRITDLRNVAAMNEGDRRWRLCEIVSTSKGWRPMRLLVGVLYEDKTSGSEVLPFLLQTELAPPNFLHSDGHCAHIEKFIVMYRTGLAAAACATRIHPQTTPFRPTPCQKRPPASFRMLFIMGEVGRIRIVSKKAFVHLLLIMINSQRICVFYEGTACNEHQPHIIHIRLGHCM